MFPTQDADDEDPRFLWLPAEVFGRGEMRKQLQDEPAGQKSRDRISHFSGVNIDVSGPRRTFIP